MTDSSGCLSVVPVQDTKSVRMKTLIMLEQYEKISAFQAVLNGLKHEKHQ